MCEGRAGPGDESKTEECGTATEAQKRIPLISMCAYLSHFSPVEFGTERRWRKRLSKLTRAPVCSIDFQSTRLLWPRRARKTNLSAKELPVLQGKARTIDLVVVLFACLQSGSAAQRAIRITLGSVNGLPPVLSATFPVTRRIRSLT